MTAILQRSASGQRQEEIQSVSGMYLMGDYGSLE